MNAIEATVRQMQEAGAIRPSRQRHVGLCPKIGLDVGKAGIDPETKERIIAAVLGGMKVTAAAEQFNVSRQTITKWIKRMKT